MADSRLIKLKVCGMRDAENILTVSKLSPDYMGFIFFKGSSRYVGVDFEIPKGFPVAVEKVGVFVNESVNVIMREATRHGLSIIQLHGNEEPGQCAAIRSAGLKVIKVFPVASTFDAGIVESFGKVVDFFLFDSKGRNFGGNGLAFDWKVLKDYTMDVPFFLSGGISPANVAGIPTTGSMHAIDVNSGVEKSPGSKDPELLRDLISQIPIK